ncbi:hypothetical protein PRIPAC_75268, partial [Pristionchus pacificus]
FESALLYWFYPAGLLTMIGRMVQFVVDVQRAITDFAILLTSPTSIMAAIGLLLQFVAAALLAVIVPISIRSLILPSSIESTTPLNLVFDACEDQIHAICSFPTASLHVDENTLFSPNIHYALTVKLQFAEVESTKKLGLFQNVLRVYDDEDRLMREYSRTSYIREPSIVKKATWLFFLPLYLTGFFTTAAQLDVPVTTEHFENPSNPTSRIFFQLQNRFAEVETAELSVVAQFGMVRHLLYYYPVTTFALLWLPTFSTLCALLFVNWGMRVTREVAGELEKRGEERRRMSVTSAPAITDARRGEEKTVDRQRSRVIAEEEEREDSQLTPSSSRSSTASFEEVVHVVEEPCKCSPVKASDEFIPDNVDELPECAPPLLIDDLTSLTTVIPAEYDSPAPLSPTVIPLEYGSEPGPRKRR